MGNAGETNYDAAHCRGRYAGCRRYRRRGHDVRQVVAATELNVANFAYRFQCGAAMEHYSPILQVASLHRSLDAKPLGRVHGVQDAPHRIVGIQDGQVALPLMGKDVDLRGDVGVHTRMAVQVVGGDVQDGGNRRTVRQGLQLKAAHLQNHPLVGSYLTDLFDQGRPDIAAHVHRQPRAPQHLPGQRRRRGLSAAAGDAYNPPLTQLE